MCPLRPATDHSLGRPLPYQLANRTQAHLQAPYGFNHGCLCPMASCGIRPPFGGLFLTRREITHVLLTRSPLVPELPPKRARLACVRHAANVHSEPGSNSPVIKELLRVLFVLKSGKLNPSMSLRFLFQRSDFFRPGKKRHPSTEFLFDFSLAALFPELMPWKVMRY